MAQRKTFRGRGGAPKVSRTARSAIRRSDELHRAAVAAKRKKLSDRKR